MQDSPTLTTRDLDEIVAAGTPLFCPDTTGIKKGDRFQLWAKVGGDMQLVTVQAKDIPYRKGKSSIYIDVFGYGVRTSVNVKKLLKAKK